MATGETESVQSDAGLFVATLREQRAAERRWLADQKSSADPKAKLFAAVQPWLVEKIKAWMRGPLVDWDSEPSVPGAGLAQQFRILLWEAVCEWEQGLSTNPVFSEKATGVVITKALAKIRQWYRAEKERFWMERTAVMGDEVDANLVGRVEYLRRAAQQDQDPEERRGAAEAAKIAAKVGTDKGDTRTQTRRRVQRLRAKQGDALRKLERMGLGAETAFSMLVSLHTRPTKVPREAIDVLLAKPGVKPMWDEFVQSGGLAKAQAGAEERQTWERYEGHDGWMALEELGYGMGQDDD